MAERYKPEHIAWLLENVSAHTADGKTSIVDCCSAYLAEWYKLTGREIHAVSLSQLYHVHKSKRSNALASSTEKRELAPGSLVVTVEAGNRFAKIYPTLDSALAEVNGNVAKFEFYEARKLSVRYKTILVVE